MQHTGILRTLDFNYIKRRSSTQLFFILACILMLSVENSSAQEVKVKAIIDSNSILIGDQINFTLRATYNPQQFSINFPSPADTFNHFEVVERGKIDTSFGRDENTYTQVIKITNFDSGQWKIPALVVDVKSLQGAEPAQLFTDSFLVNVQTIPVDTSKPFKPIFGIRAAKMPFKVILQYILIGLLFLLAAGLLSWYLYKKYKANKNKAVPQEPEILLKPHEKALADLQKIEHEKLWQVGREKDYHTELTDVVRTYLEQQFNIDCFEKTSAEIIQQIKKIKALSTSRQSLRDIFETADMVKFAKNKPNPEEHLQSMELAKDFIHESYKRIKPLINEIKPA